MRSDNIQSNYREGQDRVVFSSVFLDKEFGLKMASRAQFEPILDHFETWQKNINNITAKNDENFISGGQFHLLLKVEEG